MSLVSEAPTPTLPYTSRIWLGCQSLPCGVRLLCDCSQSSSPRRNHHLRRQLYIKSNTKQIAESEYKGELYIEV